MKRIDDNGSFSSSNEINPLHSMSVSLTSKDDDIKNKYIINQQQFLSSYFNLFILFFYQTFTIIGTAACAAAGVSLYNVKYQVSLDDVFTIGNIGNMVHYYSQLFMGYILANYKLEKYGRQKPYIMIGYMGQCLAVYCLFYVELFVDTKSNSALAIWFLLWQISYEFFNAVIYVPFQLLLIESAANNDDYTTVQSTSCKYCIIIIIIIIYYLLFIIY